MNTFLAIIGAGAAGLMAAAAAAEKGLRFVLIERKHKPGRKLLLCGNNRCNLSSDMSVDQLRTVYGPPVDSFLEPALKRFTPHDLCEWFEQHNLPLKTDTSGRIYPASEKADDVLHVFTDLLRDREIPILYQCPVHTIEHIKNGYRLLADRISLQCTRVLIATGGVSYPKTGSVGDGQKIAARLGHKVTPFRPGLVGFSMKSHWLNAHADDIVPEALVTVHGPGGEQIPSCGPLIPTRWGVRGGAVHDAARAISRREWKQYTLTVDFCPDLPRNKLESHLRSQASHTLQQTLQHWLPTASFCRDFIEHTTGQDGRMKTGSLPANDFTTLCRALKAFPLPVTAPRSLKEAMVTVGGVSLNDVHPQSLESRKHKGLYFAGEVLDIDGPTGGFNLQAAFSTARLAVDHIASSADAPAVPDRPNRRPSDKDCGRRKPRRRRPRGNRPPRRS